MIRLLPNSILDMPFQYNSDAHSSERNETQEMRIPIAGPGIEEHSEILNAERAK